MTAFGVGAMAARVGLEELLLGGLGTLALAVGALGGGAHLRRACGRAGSARRCGGRSPVGGHRGRDGLDTARTPRGRALGDVLRAGGRMARRHAARRRRGRRELAPGMARAAARRFATRARVRVPAAGGAAPTGHAAGRSRACSPGTACWQRGGSGRCSRSRRGSACSSTPARCCGFVCALAAATGAILLAACSCVLPGTLYFRRHIERSSQRLVIVLGLAAAVVAALSGRSVPALWLTVLLLAVYVFLNPAERSPEARFGLDAAPGRSVMAMGLRASAAQLGYLIGAGVGGLALHFGGYAALGAAFCGLYVLAVVPHVIMAVAGGTAVRSGPVGLRGARMARSGERRIAQGVGDDASELRAD